jgi:hypothetical protein
MIGKKLMLSKIIFLFSISSIFFLTIKSIEEGPNLIIPPSSMNEFFICKKHIHAIAIKQIYTHVTQ